MGVVRVVVAVAKPGRDAARGGAGVGPRVRVARGTRGGRVLGGRRVAVPGARGGVRVARVVAGRGRSADAAGGGGKERSEGGELFGGDEHRGFLFVS